MSNTEPTKHQQHRKLKRWVTQNPPKTTTQKTKKMSNTEPTKNTTQKTKEMSNTEPTKNYNTEN